jgi:hypothetical protein
MIVLQYTCVTIILAWMRTSYLNFSQNIAGVFDDASNHIGQFKYLVSYYSTLKCLLVLNIHVVQENINLFICASESRP